MGGGGGGMGIKYEMISVWGIIKVQQNLEILGVWRFVENIVMVVNGPEIGTQQINNAHNGAARASYNMQTWRVGGGFLALANGKYVWFYVAFISIVGVRGGTPFPTFPA